MINIIKNIADIPATTDEVLYMYKVVDSSYVPTLEEEFVIDPKGVEHLANNSRIDYIQYRTYLQEYCCVLEVWEGLSSEQRDMIISHYQKPDEISWDATLKSDPELKKYWISVVKRETMARAERFNEGKALISWALTKPEAFDLAITIDSFVELWVQYDLPILWAYINNINLVGTPYDFTTTGFSSKPYYSVEKRDLLNYIILR
jgi:hypothetical protein